MTQGVQTVTEATPLDEVVELIESLHIKRTPVVRDDGLVGVVSWANLLRAVSQELRKITLAASSDTDDTELREQIVAELRKRNRGGRSHVTVVVREGVAYLEGIIYDARERDAIRVAAENVAGVKDVRDHLDYWDPNAGLGYKGYDRMPPVFARPDIRLAHGSG